MEEKTKPIDMEAMFNEIMKRGNRQQRRTLKALRRRLDKVNDRTINRVYDPRAEDYIAQIRAGVQAQASRDESPSQEERP